MFFAFCRCLYSFFFLSTPVAESQSVLSPNEAFSQDQSSASTDFQNCVSAGAQIGIRLLLYSGIGIIIYSIFTVTNLLKILISECKICRIPICSYMVTIFALCVSTERILAVFDSHSLFHFNLQSLINRTMLLPSFDIKCLYFLHFDWF